jgi:sn-glycerol 3-phosphate transport system ATP-binding protein
LPAGTGETLGLSWQDGQQHFFAADSAVINIDGR